MTKASNVILVHGAWADGSSWSKVIPLLLDGGLRATAAQLPLTSLKDDLEDGSIILVGHSYGGVVITEAGDDPKVAGLVYIAAFAPDGVVESQTKLVSRCNGGPRHPAKPGKSDGQGHLRQDGRP